MSKGQEIADKVAALYPSMNLKILPPVSDRMTPGERMAALARRQPLDRVPVIPFASAWTAVTTGLPVADFYLEPEKAAQAQLTASERHGYDGTPSFAIPDWPGWDFGGDMRFPRDPPWAFPYLTRRPAKDPSDVEALRLPDPRTAPAYGRVFAFARIAAERGWPIGVTGGSPTNLVGAIVGQDLLLRWYVKKSDVVHRLFRLATDYIYRIAQIFAEEFGVEKLTAFCTYPLDSSPVVSPRLFETFALPYVQEVHERLLALGIRRWLVHLCGDHRKNLVHWAGGIPLAPRTVFTVGTEMDLEETAATLGEAHILGGNVATDLLLQGTAEDVYDECARIVTRMKHAPGGFILMPACALPPRTPPENVDAMLQAARDHGSYD